MHLVPEKVLACQVLGCVLFCLDPDAAAMGQLGNLGLGTLLCDRDRGGGTQSLLSMGHSAWWTQVFSDLPGSLTSDNPLLCPLGPL